ncbi:hypothetical protein CCMSSC00406_0003150 [Pleurotus cornucopiae]|uniref:Uncharacterized protein n=1 Tax=Pleurotus cornucopiae TaxID=5321 RepID=A0ACB7J875_PLECO|nr:hypothetical protein CCMSSC00406_0003150 [Pleurotus cornucopiae]
MAPSPSSTTTSVQVALRIRPPTSQDLVSIPARFQKTVIHAVSPTTVAVESTGVSQSGGNTPTSTASGSSAAKDKKQLFTFDQVHSPSATQHGLFTSTAEPLLARFLEGFNCTILAYGQTSSGKTFTMTGIDLDADPSDPNNGMGIIPRAVSTIFSKARQLKEERGDTWNFSIKGSFIEIYNEDLIDLLSMDEAGGRREVQIREDKDGHIIWGGLREVNVKTSNEVMSLIRKGTSIRRTNETDMNAQSSRSHAIFSLTFIQKKFVGTGQPPRSSSPLPPGRSPSRLARPGSMYSNASTAGNRASSPTPGRPGTPSFASAMGRGGLRPSSALGHITERPKPGGDDESGEWITITSKFHFVDLAGSERLKRTMAAGERIKEGISINSGLLALGNVISALGDPSRAKSHTATHVPYRDSKLTRLLQDSLGGNAHTLMIACVSPAEWNTAETVNTLKYANRARNIKNRAVVNEKEDGWDDVEWLQGTVLRLRKEVKVLKDGGVPDARAIEPPALEGAGKKVLAQMSDLQSNYEDLREKFVERTEELTRLRRELGERHRTSSAGSVGGTAKYEEIVGPVIEEYEKTIAAMEAELNLNRVALRHANEMVEEKEDELATITERHAATELYVEELRTRVAKLTEREASTEAYVHDLEEKMKLYDETSISSSESMTDLKREINRFKDTESHSAKYISDLEARLARSDESILDLQKVIERLESECERRRDEVENLQSRLESLRQDGESWRADLEEREQRVKELEGRMEEWERRRQEAGETRARLGAVVGEVALARRSLELDLAGVNGASSSSVGSTPVHTNGHSSPIPEEPATPTRTEQSLEGQLSSLQQTHTATLADLASVTSKYRDALREISDLAAQIQEAKLSSSAITDSPRSETPVDPPRRRRLTGGRNREASDPQIQPALPGKRPFFRQAASAESLHSRSLSQSLSLSQELSSARSRKASFSTSSSHSPSHSHSNSAPFASPRPNLSISLPASNERSVASLESEIMRLQDVLKEREAEIAALEISLREKPKVPSGSPTSIDDIDTPPSTPPNDVLPNGDQSLASYLTPKTMGQFENIRRSMELNGRDHLFENGSEVASNVSEMDESLDRLNELMLSMAQKEAYHKEVVDTLNDQLGQVKRQLDDLTTLSRDQALNMSTEIQVLQAKHSHDLELLEEVRKHEAELVTNLKEAEATHLQAVEDMRLAHEGALNARGIEVDTLITSMKEEHDSALEKLRAELSEASTEIEKLRHHHEQALAKAHAEHAEELQRQAKEAEDILDAAQKAHEAAVAKLARDHEESLKQKEAEATAVLQTTEEEYYNALTKLRCDHATALEKQATDAAATLERLREEHAGELRITEITKQGSIAASESSRTLALQELQDEHAAAIARKEASHADAVEQLKAEHLRALTTKDEDFALQLDRLRAEYESTTSRLKEEWRVETQKLKNALTDSEEQVQAAASTSTKVRSEMEAKIQTLQEQQALILKEVEQGHEEDVAALKRTHDAALLSVKAKAQQDLVDLLKSHTEEKVRLQAEHQQALADVNAEMVALQEQHHEALALARSHSEGVLEEERQRLQTTLADLERQHAEERDILRRDHDLLAQELESHKVAADEFTLIQESMRDSHDQALAEKSASLQQIQNELSNVSTERDQLQAELARLRSELDKTHSEQSKLVQEASKRQSLVDELEKHRTELAESQELTQRLRDEKDNLLAEKQRQDSVIRDLQAQVARSSSPPNGRPLTGYNRGTGLPTMKLPPPTPPPSVPPPPAPRSLHLNGDHNSSISSQSSSVTMSNSSKESQMDSPTTSVGGSINGMVTPVPDAKFTIRLEQQAKQIEEQEAMIKTLNKQLTHCESDLQTHMDLVSTLETSLGDSEKNLRKARMHATELARERDTLNVKIEGLRSELTEARREVATVRKSIQEEKQSLEQRLDEERKAKERVRAQLDTRMEELQRKKSKFACL